MQRTTWIVLLALLLAPLALGGVDSDRRAYHEKSQALSAEDASGHYLLGLWCRQRGLGEESRLEFERVIALMPDHEGARRGLGYERDAGMWLSHDEALTAKGLVCHEGVWMLPEEVFLLTLPKNEKERMKAEQAKARKILRTMISGGAKVQRVAMQALAGVEDRYKVSPLSYALRYPEQSVRIFAAGELARIGDWQALRPLVHRSLVDPVPAVREAMLTAAMGFEDANLLAPYAKALLSENQALRINAAHSIGDLGEVVGVEYLIYSLRAHGGGVCTAHIYMATQLSFIQDFDVEVAQTSFIADPMVGILQEGQVLQAKVIANERRADILERRVIRRSLRKLSGVDLGDKPGPWAKWWTENKAELVSK